MLRVNSINNLSCDNRSKTTTKPNFTANNQCPQATTLPDCTVDVNTKVPIKYQKINELQLPYNYKAHCYKLANGQRVIILPKEGETVIETYVGTGSMNEPDNVRGISHYIEHNLFNGSRGLEAGEFFKTVNKMGAETNASTSFATTDYYISSNLLKNGDLEKEIKLHSSMLETPKFAIEMLEKEKGIVNSEISMYEGYANNIATNATLKKLFNIQSTSNDLIAGTINNINNITRDDVVDYYNNNYYPDNMVTVITGEVDPEDTMKLISKYFSGTNKNTHPRKFEKLTPINKTTRQDIISDKTNATLAVLGFCGPKNNDAKSKVCVDIIQSLLTHPKTGKLDKALKQYNSYANINTEKISSRPHDNSVILVEVETNEENCEKVLQEIYNQIHSITTDTNFDSELASVKKSFINSRALSYENSSGLNYIIGSNMLNESSEIITDYENIVNSITKEDIINTAKEYFDLNKTAITVVHPQKTDNKGIAFTGNPLKTAINENNVQRHQTYNNFDVITNNSKTDMSALNIHYDYDKEYLKNINPAAISILNNILQEGSFFRNDVELNKDLQQDAISMHFTMNDNGITILSNFAQQDTQKALKTAKEVIYNPRFTQESFDFSKNKLIEDYTHKQKSAYDKLYKEVIPDFYTNDEIINGAKTVTLKEVMDLYYYILNNSQCHIGYSAPIDKNPQLQAILFDEIIQLPNVQPTRPYLRNIYTPTEQTKVLTQTDTKPQAQIVEGYKFNINGNLKDKVTIDILNNILGSNSSSRLFNDLREKQQLAYSVGSKVEYIDNIGFIKLEIKTTTENKDKQSFDNVRKSIDGFNKHINKIKTEKVTNEELENAKQCLKNTILSINETTIEKNLSLTNNAKSYYGILEDNEALKLIDSITIDDVYNAANYIFSTKPTYSILATENTIKANEEYFKTLQ